MRAVSLKTGLRRVFMSKNTKGVMILLTAALIWGMSFPAQDIVIDHHVGAFTFNCIRSFMAAALLLAIQYARMRRGSLQASLPDGGRSEGPKIFCQPRRMVLAAGILCGIALFCGITFQQYGMELYPEGAASSGRAGFLTSVYVIIVALLSFFTAKKPKPIVIAAAFVCLIGMYMLCLAGGISGIYAGDVFMLIAAFGFSAQIMLIDYFSGIDGLTVSGMQFLVCGILSLIGAIAADDVNWADVASVVIPLLYCGIGSSAGGYTLQIIGQKYADPAPASIAMSMESVFSGIGGWILLGQTMSGRELAGCALVFASVIMTQIPSFFRRTLPAAKTVNAGLSTDRTEGNRSE